MKTSSIKRITFVFVTVFTIFLIWELISLSKNNEIIYPSIFTIFERIFSELKNLKNIGIILLIIPKVLLVVLISALIAILIGYLYYLLPSSIYFIRPLIVILKVAPFASIAVYVIMAVSRASAPYVLTFFVSLPIIMEGLISSVDNIDRGIKDDLELLNVSKFRKYLSVVFPLIINNFITTILQVFGLGIKTMIMGEYLCSKDNTIGGILYAYKSSLGYDYILAWLIIIVFVCSIIDLIIRLINKRINKMIIN